TDALHQIAAAMVAPGKGILAADESSGTISKRFAALGIPSTVELRRQYRQALLTAPGIDSYISGVILYDETIRQADDDGTPFPEVLSSRGILPGIKVDTGAKSLAGAQGETITEGLDGLRERIAEYYELGARFAKWRAVITIGDGKPSRNALHANAHALARYGALCQEGGLVPIIEPEVLMDGDHDLATCDRVTHETLAVVFAQLRLAGIDLEGMVLKPSMVISGTKGPGASVEEVAAATVRCLSDTVPASVPGCAFLSGGQSSVVATEHLNAMNRMGPHPWQLTFSYGRALQDDALRTWSGEATNAKAAQDVLLLRSRANGKAALGQYDPSSEAA
ncbi:MAG: class I fructose-bisphosphate aldolase, partial [Acidimicrobiales bacterium]